MYVVCTDWLIDRQAHIWSDSHRCSIFAGGIAFLTQMSSPTIGDIQGQLDTSLFCLFKFVKQLCFAFTFDLCNKTYLLTYLQCVHSPQNILVTVDWILDRLASDVGIIIEYCHSSDLTNADDDRVRSVRQTEPRPTMVTKFKIKSVITRLAYEIYPRSLRPIGGFRDQDIQWCQPNFMTTDPGCHGNEFSEKWL